MAAGPTSSSRDYVAIANGYVRDVLTGRQVACQWVRLACERQERDLRRASSEAGWAYQFDDWRARDVCDFIEKLPHIEGEWATPTIRLEPWQIFILTTLFGWRRAGGHRRFNTGYFECARKNAKSTLASGIALYCLTCEGENGPQVKCSATTGRQARVVFNVAKAMVKRTPALRRHFLMEPLANAVYCHMNGGNIEPINAKAGSQEGLNPHCSIIDELHAHKSRALFDVLKSARGSRKNPLSWYQTTAGYNMLGVCYEQRALVTKALQGLDGMDHYFGIIYTLDEGDSAYDETVWVKANPNLGVSVQLDEMRTYAVEAKNSAESEGEFKTKRLNLWLNAALAWLNLAQWDACKDTTLTLADFEGQDAWVGGDLAELDDLAALAIVFERQGVYHGFVRFYLPRHVVEEKARDVPAYRAWADAGVLTLTEGNTIDYGVIEDDVRAWSKRFKVRSILFDHYQSGNTTIKLFNEGLPAAAVLKNAANFTIPSKELEARVKHGTFRHDGNPILRWNAMNAVVSRGVDGSILPKKETKDSANKIDGLDALLQAMGPLATLPPPKVSRYAEGGGYIIGSGGTLRDAVTGKEIGE